MPAEPGDIEINVPLCVAPDPQLPQSVKDCYVTACENYYTALTTLVDNMLKEGATREEIQTAINNLYQEYLLSVQVCDIS